QQEHRKVVEAARVTDRRLNLEEEAEDHREDEHAGQRIQQRPRPTEHGALVATAELAEGEVPEQLPRARVFGQSGHYSDSTSVNPITRRRRAASLRCCPSSSKRLSGFP